MQRKQIDEGERELDNNKYWLKVCRSSAGSVQLSTLHVNDNLQDTSPPS